MRTLMRTGGLTSAAMARVVAAITAAGVLGFALPAAVAMAQTGQGAQGVKPQGVTPAAKKPPSSVGGVTVQGTRPRSKLSQIPPDKAAAFDEEAAKNEAWKKYRKSTPPLAAGTLGQSSDYPGLHNLARH